MNIVVDDLMTNYEMLGSGEVVLFLHGWGDNLQTFNSLRNNLAKKYKTIALDLPGFGKTEAPKEVWGLSDYAKFLSSFLVKLDIGKVKVLIGHSNGGAVAIKSVADNILDAEKLVLLSSAGIRDQQKGKRLFLKVIAKTGKVATFWLPLSSKQKLQKKLYGTVGSDMLLVPNLKETFKKTASEDVQSSAREITQPTLLIYGDNDKATPPIYGRIYHELIANSELEIIGSADHFVHTIRPEIVLKLMQDFIND